MVPQLRKNVAYALLLVAIPLAVLMVFLGNYALLLSSGQYLSSVAEKTATPYMAAPPVTPDLAAKISADVISYIRGSQPQLAYSSHFSQEELLHLNDVRSRVAKSFYLLYLLAAATAVTAILAFVITHNGGIFLLRRALFAAGVLTIALAVFLALAFLSFSPAFTAFHRVLFGSSQWQFPSGYLLVNLFTEGFFAEFARDVIAASLVQGTAVFLAAVVMGWFYSARKNNSKKKRAKS